MCLWQAVSATIHLVSYGNLFAFHGDAGFWYWLTGIVVYFAGLIIYVSLSIWFAYILLCRSEWLARKVGIDEQGSVPNWPGEKKLLNLGIILLGIYISSFAIPRVVRSLSLSLGNSYFWHGNSQNFYSLLSADILPVLADVLQVCIGFAMIVWPGRIMRCIERIQKRFDRPAVEAAAPE